MKSLKNKICRSFVLRLTFEISGPCVHPLVDLLDHNDFFSLMYKMLKLDSNKLYFVTLTRVQWELNTEINVLSGCKFK